MSTSAAHRADTSTAAPSTPLSGTRGPGTYVISGARQYAITNLAGTVAINGEVLPARFTLESALLAAGETFTDVTVTVSPNGSAFVSSVI